MENGPDGGSDVGGPAVREIISVNGGEDDIVETPLHHGCRRVLRLHGVHGRRRSGSLQGTGFSAQMKEMYKNWVLHKMLGLEA
jgi:hypothetical protein